jgi:hypothetical protein
VSAKAGASYFAGLGRESLNSDFLKRMKLGGLPRSVIAAH